MRFKQLKLLYVAGFVVIVGLVVGGGYSWRSWGGEKEVVFGNEVEMMEDVEKIEKIIKKENENGEMIIINREEIDIRDLDTFIPTVTLDLSDWKIYQDPRFNFQIKYPENFIFEIIDVSELDNILYIMAFRDEKYKNSDISQPPQVGITVFPNFGKESIEEWIKKHATTAPFQSSDDPSMFFEGVTLVKKTTIDDLDGLYLEYESLTKGKSVLLFKDDTIIELSTIFSHVESINKIFENWIFTFSFH